MARPLAFALLLFAALAAAPGVASAQDSSDWPDLARYAEANAALGAPDPAGPPRIVFMGNSITEGWARDSAGIFMREPNYIGRGISGQTTPQMLIRFRPDVIALRPAAVVLLAGINDIAQNTGPITLEETAGNLMSMAELARAHGIAVVISSVLPAFDFPWRPGMAPAQKVVALNEVLRDYAEREGFVYLDYFGAMADGRPGLPAELASDGIHPTPAGYRVMEPLVEDAIAEALARQATVDDLPSDSTQSTIPSMTDSPAADPGVVHTVYFWLKPGLSEADHAEFEAAVRGLSASPSVRRLIAGGPATTPAREGVTDNAFDLMLSLWFDDVAGHDAYQVSDVHLAFVAGQETKFDVVKVYDSEGK